MSTAPRGLALPRARWLVLLCGAVAYATSLRGPFVFDDRGVVTGDVATRSLSSFWRHGAQGLRPLLKLSYAACASLGLGPLGYHLFNLLVHLGCVWLVMTLARRAQERVTKSGGDGMLELSAGLLFAVHPLHSEAVTYVSGRSSALMALAYLGALLAYAHGVREARAGSWALAAPALWIVALLVKETAITLPLALLLWERCIEHSPLRAVVRRQLVFWALAGATFVAVVMHPRYYALLYDVLGTRPLPLAVALQLHGATYLLSRLVLVHQLSIDPGLALDSSTSSVPLSLLALAWLGLSVIAVLLRKRQPLLAFGLLWYALHLFLPYTLLSRDDVINERHAYLADVGLFLALGALWSSWRSAHAHSRAPLLAAACAIALLAGFTWSRNADYQSALSLWTQTVQVSPENPRAHNNLGISHEGQGQIAAACEAYCQALVLEPRYTSARRNLFRVDARCPKPPAPDSACASWEQVRRAGPGTPAPAQVAPE